MAFDYAGIAAEVLAILQEFGRAGTLVKRAGSAYNTSTRIISQTPTNYAITVAVLDQPEATKENSAVVHKQRKAFIAASGLAVAIDSEDHVLVGSERFKVVVPGPINPGGTTVVYDAVLEA